MSEATSKRRLVNICVFCGSNIGKSLDFVTAATELGRTMLRRKIHLVYGGGNVGLMGVISRIISEGGGQVMGIIPATLANESMIGKTNGEEIIVSGIHDQIIKMSEHADAFIALPGGLGTLEEMFTISSWNHLNIHQKPIGVLNVNGYYDCLFMFLDDAKRHGFTNRFPKDIFLSATTADALIDQLLNYEPIVDPVTSRLNWTGDSSFRRSKRFRLDLFLTTPMFLFIFMLFLCAVYTH